MGTHIVIDGTAFYEVDEDCLRRQRKEQGGQMATGNEYSGRTMGNQGNGIREEKYKRKNQW